MRLYIYLHMFFKLSISYYVKILLDLVFQDISSIESIMAKITQTVWKNIIHFHSTDNAL